MLIWTLFVGCGNDHLLTNTIVRDADTAAPVVTPAPEKEAVCDGPKITVAPDTVSFLAILTPFEKDVKLRTDVKSIFITNNCDTDLVVYVTAGGGSVGEFVLRREDGDEDGGGSGEFAFVLPAFESRGREVAYTVDERAAVAEYDDGTFHASVVEGAELGFEATAALEATVINVLIY